MRCTACVRVRCKYFEAQLPKVSVLCFLCYSALLVLHCTAADVALLVLLALECAASAVRRNTYRQL